VGAALAELRGGSDGFAPDCPTRVLLDHITSRWGVLILVALSSGTMRWGELRRWARGISEKMLAQTLRTLEADGLVLREQRPVVPPHVDYSLTDRGRELSALLLPLMEWIIATAPPQPTAAPASTLDAQLPGQGAAHSGSRGEADVGRGDLAAPGAQETP
jgi:DNA-binding HxlR family transcriptional regulator